MNNPIVKYYKKLSMVTAYILMGLLLSFYVAILILSYQLFDQVTSIRSHPFPVAVSAGEMNSLTYHMQMLNERLEYVQTDEVIDSVEGHLGEIEDRSNQLMQIIVERYLVNPDYAVEMNQTFEKLMTNEYELLDLYRQSNVTDSEIGEYIALNITPLLDKVQISAETIVTNASGRFDVFAKNAETYRNIMLILSTVLTAGVLTAIVIYLRIISKKESKEVELLADMEVAMAAAKAANTAKSQFLSNMSHDIRTPMNAIIGMTAIADNYADDPDKVRDCLHKITTASNILLGLINNVLDMSKIESGKLLINEEVFRLPDLFQSVATVVEPQIKAKQHKLQVSVNIENEQVLGDTLRLQQVIMNLLGNAIKFTPNEGEIKIALSQEPFLHNGYGDYKFTISDSGIGMKEEFLEHLFEPFERERNAVVGNTEGTGLGLAIAKSIVDMMGGQLSVSSQIGRGTTFTVIIPFKVSDDAVEEANDTETDMDIKLRKGKVLVVEDNEINVEIAEALLEAQGVGFKSVYDGQQAVDAIKEAAEGSYDLILMDIQMPIMDGYTAANEIRDFEERSSRKPIPIVALSANVFAEDLAKAKEAGMDDYLTKPIISEKLKQVLIKYLSEKS